MTLRLILSLLLVGVVTSAQSATIYRCKTYEGGAFWSAGTCSNHKALIDRMVSVPDGMPFEQQVRMAEQQLNAKAVSDQNNDNERHRIGKCAAINSELKTIWSKYENGQHVPADIVGPDQNRWRDLQSQRRQNRCNLD